MADRKSSDNPLLTTLADGDLFDVLDESETTDSLKNKSTTYRNLADQIISEVPSEAVRHKASFDSQITLTGSYQTVASSLDSSNTDTRAVLLRLTGATYNDDTDVLSILFEGSDNGSTWAALSGELLSQSVSSTEMLFSLAFPVATNDRYFRARVRANMGGGSLGLRLRNVTFEYNLLD